MSLLSTEEPPASPGSRAGLVVGALLIVGLLAGGALLLLGGGGAGPHPPTADTDDGDAVTRAPAGSLEITSDTEGAVVYLDGRRLGLAPQTETALAPGRYQVRVERFGREPFERDVEIRAGEERILRAALEPVPGAPTRAEAAGGPALRVVADVPGASVFVDREFVGKTPVEIAELEPGPHRLNVSADGYEMHVEEIEAGGTPREIQVRFKQVRLQQTVAVKHKRAFGSNDGTLSATPEGVRFESEKPKDSFHGALDDLEDFEVDYLKNNLKIRIRGGRTYNFTSSSGNPDDLFVFHREVEQAISRLAPGTVP